MPEGLWRKKCTCVGLGSMLQTHTHTNALKFDRLYRLYVHIIEGSLEVKLPTIWTDEKQRWEESEKRREEKKNNIKKEKHCFSNDLWLQEGRKGRLAKAAGARASCVFPDERCARRCGVEALFEVQIVLKHFRVRSQLLAR